MLKLRDWIDINKINWHGLSINPNAIELLKENQNVIELLKETQKNLFWFNFSRNPNIFTYDYIKIKVNMKNSGIKNELMAFIFNPKNMNKWIDWGFTEHYDFLEFINT